jgi:UDP-N-acetyl-2-amino-2-deoxyglucuronate dehydrogenase
MPDKLHVGMIGCGEIAYRETAPAIQAAGNAEMAIAMDTVEHVARSFGETYGVPATTCLEDVLEHPDVDTVVISVPHDLHLPLTVRAARAGKHVMVEKPVAVTLEQADEMIAVCRDAGVRLGVLYVTRYNAEIVRAKELIEQGAVGRVIAQQFHLVSNKAESYWTSGYSGRVQTDWRKSKERSGGGTLIMNLSHDIDRLRWVTGLEAVRVYAEYDTFATDVEVEDTIALTLRYDNGAVGTLYACSCAPGAGSNGDRIYGDQGQIVFGRDSLRVYTEAEVVGLERGAWTEIEPPVVDARQVFVERFARAVLEGGALDIPGEEGRKTLETVVAAYRSGETHRPVTLPLEK